MSEQNENIVEDVKTPAAEEATATAAPAPKTTPTEDFDWDAYEKGDHIIEDRVALTQQYDATLNTIKEKEVVDGTVISMNKREVVVNIGYKSDGVIALNEFRYNPDLKVGDTVEVYIENLEDKKGQLALSHRKARASRSWEHARAVSKGVSIRCTHHRYRVMR